MKRAAILLTAILTFSGMAMANSYIIQDSEQNELFVVDGPDGMIGVNTSDPTAALDVEGDIEMRNDRLLNYFPGQTCGSGEVVEGINDDGSYQCTEVDAEASIQTLNETLEAGNLANQSIYMEGNGLLNVGSLTGEGIIDAEQMSFDSVNGSAITENAVGDSEIDNEQSFNVSGLLTTGQLDMDENRIVNVPSPQTGGDAVNKTYVDEQAGEVEGDATQNLEEVLEEGNVAGAYDINMDGNDITDIRVLNASNGEIVVEDNISMSNRNIVDLADPINSQDAVPKSYVDSEADDATQTLAEVLSEGNVAEDPINMSGENIQEIGNLGGTGIVSEEQIVVGSVSNDSIQSYGDFTIQNLDITDDLTGTDIINTEQIGSKQVTSGEIGSNQVGTDQLAIAAVTNTTLDSSDSFDMNELEINTDLTGTSIVDNDQIAGSAVETNELASDAVTNATLDSSDVYSMNELQMTGLLDVNGNNIVEPGEIQTGGTDLTIRDSTNAEDLARFPEDGAVEIDNRNLSLQENYLVDVQQINLTSGTTIDGSFDIEESNITMNANNITDVYELYTRELYSAEGEEILVGDSLDMQGNDIASIGALNATGTEIQVQDNLSMQGRNIVDLANPINPQDAATKDYTDSQIEDVEESTSQNLSEVLEEGNVANQSIDMDGSDLQNVDQILGDSAPVNFGDGIDMSGNNISQLDTIVSSGETVTIHDSAEDSRFLSFEESGNISVGGSHNLEMNGNRIVNPSRVDGVDIENPGNALVVDSEDRYAVGAGSISDGEITGNSLTNSSIDSSSNFTFRKAELRDNLAGTSVVDTEQISDSAVTFEEIGTGQVRTEELDADAVTNETLESYGEFTLQDLDITSDLTGTGIVDTEQLATSAVTNDELGTGSVNNDSIESYGSFTLQNLDVTDDLTGTDIVNTEQIGDNQITSDEIGTGQVGTNQLADAAVTNTTLDSSESFTVENLEVGNEIQQFFEDACQNDEVMAGINDDGGYVCESVSDLAEDEFVEVSGDNMTGNLEMNQNRILEVGSNGIDIGDGAGDIDMSGASIYGADIAHAQGMAVTDSFSTAEDQLDSDSHSLYVEDDIDVGGDIVGTGGGDVAEELETQDEQDIEEGTVVTITGKMEIGPSQESHDTAVAGIISTDPGVRLMDQRDGEPLALSGIVPTKVTMENGEIEEGDILTTASKEGHAMKCEDRNSCTGAIIGKAMEATDENGKIEVLVTLA